jgi:hypothetical protein
MRKLTPLVGLTMLLAACGGQGDGTTAAPGGPQDTAAPKDDPAKPGAEVAKAPETPASQAEPASAPVAQEPEEEPLRWVKVTEDKYYLRAEPSNAKPIKFVGLARPMSAIPVYEELAGDGCKGKWLRVGPKSFPGYACSTSTKKAEAPSEVVEDPKDPTKRNGLSYAIVIKDTSLYSSPGGAELETIRPKESYVTVIAEKKVGADTWVKTADGWLPKKALRASSAKGITALRGEILSEGDKLPWVFVVAKEAKVFPNAGDTTGEVATVKRYDRFPVLEVKELDNPDPKKKEKVRWARIESGWVEGKKLDWVLQQPRPEGVGPNDKWIFADLEQQALTAYEGDRPVFISLFSSGRAPNYTVTGTYNVHRIYRTHTMENAPGGDEESYYFVSDVPFVMFFHKTFALHGAYWHDQFGGVRSHGCVNMAPADAKWVYDWINPQVPKGWWGVAVEEADAKTRGWTTVVTKWGDRIVRDEDVMNPNAHKIVEAMRQKKEKEGELADAPASAPAGAGAVGAGGAGTATPASAPASAPAAPAPTPTGASVIPTRAVN